MRTALVFVALLAVTQAAYAEETARCSDRAYSVFRECLEVYQTAIEMNEESDLYSSREKMRAVEEMGKCLDFRKNNESRYRACQERMLEDAVQIAMEEHMAILSPEQREKLDNLRRFNRLLEAMILRGSPPDRRKSKRDPSADCSDTQTPSHTSKDVSEKHEHESLGSRASGEPRNPQAS